MNLQGSIVEGNGRITFPAWKYLDEKENRKGMQDSEGFGPFLHSHGMHLSCLTFVVKLEGKNGRLRETMGAKFTIFLVALLCNIAAHHSDVIRKLGWSNSGHSGIPQLIKVCKFEHWMLLRTDTLILCHVKKKCTDDAYADKTTMFHFHC